jgi:hypothetical protein
MPLNKDALGQSLRDLFSGVGAYPVDAAHAGARWASVYAAYAKNAVAGITAPVASTIDTSAGPLGTSLASAFTSAQAAGAGFLTALVSGMVSAFSAFWSPVQFVGGAIGVAASPPPAALTTALTSFLTAGNPPSGPKPSGDSQANSLASILDTWTKTVLVTNTPPTGTPTTVQLT